MSPRLFIAECSLRVRDFTHDLVANRLPQPEALALFGVEVPRLLVDQLHEHRERLHRALDGRRPRVDAVLPARLVERLEDVVELAVVEVRADGRRVVVSHARGNHGGARKATDRRLTEVYHG